MADAATTVSTNTEHGGGRGRHTRDAGDSPQVNGRGRGRGRGHRGGRGRGRGHSRNPSQNTVPNLPPAHTELDSENSSERPPGGFGGRLTEVAQNQDEVKAESEAVEKEDAITEDGEVCFICASPIEHLAIAPCNHQTCHICSLRLRALYKTRACAHCRVSSSALVFGTY